LDLHKWTSDQADKRVGQKPSQKHLRMQDVGIVLGLTTGQGNALQEKGPHREK